MMRDLSMAWRWALRDLRGGLRHFRLVLLCLAISVTAITAVHVTGASVMQSIEKNARVILGGDWVIRQLYSPVGKAERDWMTARGATMIDTIETRAMLLNPANDQTALIELKAVDARYPLYGEATRDPAGNFHDGLKGDGLLLDPALAARLEVKIGDTVQLGTGNFRVAGWVANEPDRAGGRRFGLAPRTFISLDNFRASGLQQPGTMSYYDLRVAWPATVGKLDAVEKQFESAFPDATWRLSNTERAAPQIQRFVDNLVQFLTLIGLSALLTGGIGIANGMRAYLQTRRTAIAVFKSLGMKASLIRAVFLWQIAIVAMTGTIIGVTLGCLAPMLALPFLESFLPFSVSVSVTLQSIAVPLLFGMLTTFIFSLWPLGEAEQTSPLLLFRGLAPGGNVRPGKHIRNALVPLMTLLVGTVIFSAQNVTFSMLFMAGAGVSFLLFHALGRGIAALAYDFAANLSLAGRMAFQNLGRRGNTTPQMLVSLGIGLTLLTAIAMIDRNLRGALIDNLPVDAPAFFFMDIQPDQKVAFETLVKTLPTASHLVMMPNLRGRIVSVNGVEAEKALIDQRESWLLQNERGFTYTSRLPAHSEITSGKWWPENYSGPPLVSVVDDVERGFGVKPGDRIAVQIMGRTIEAEVANVRNVDWTNMTINFAITFAPGALESAPHSWLATIVADPAQESAIQGAITRSFPNISMIRLSDAIDTVNDLLGQMNIAVRVMALLALATGLIVLVESLIATRAERTYDTVILKVIGVPRKILSRSMAIELFALGSVAAVISGGLGTLISWAILDGWMHLPWRFYPGLAMISMAASLILIMLAGWLVLRGLLKSPALPYLRNE